MNITILQGYSLPIPPYKGGAVEKKWFKMANEFARRGHKVIHVSRQWEDLPKHEILHGVEHCRIKGYDFQSNNFVSKILDLFYTLGAIHSIPDNAEIIITNTFWAPIILPYFRKGKVIVDVARMPKGQTRFYLHAARLRANSNATANAIRQEIPVNRYSQILMIPNCLPFETEGIEWEHKENLILYCGRVHPEKGLELLEETVRCLPNDWRFEIVGPWNEAGGGGGENYLLSLKDLFQGLRVQFHGPIYDPQKLEKLYKAAKIFVYPSIAEKGETFGLAPLEAMAFGCVPVVSNLACFKDFIVDGHNGLVFNHNDKEAAGRLAQSIKWLIEGDHPRQNLAENALAVRESHSAAHIAELFLEEFESLIKE